MRRYSKYFLACFVLPIAAFLHLLNAQYSGLAVNRWTPAADMSTARAAACSAALPDGRVLVAGGSGGSSVVNSVELYGASGGFSVAAPMHMARAGAACATLQDGRVFVAGGNDGTSALPSAEIYDPALDAWTMAGDMNVARTGHTAALLPWGSVLLVGGDDQGLVEAYNVVRGDFQQMGNLSSARKDYAVAALAHQKVAIAGGSDGAHALASVDILDFNARTVTPAGTMKTARTNFAAAGLLDGKVLFTGGLDATGRVLASSEIFDPATGESAAGPNLSEPRANHQAYALPGNGGVLLMGGTNGEIALSSTDRYSPRSGAFATAAAMKNARNAQSLSLLRRGALMVAGGRSLNGVLTSAELYGFATLTADKDEYTPGETASFTGTGWKPGEQILVRIAALPADAHKIEFSAAATADGSGRVHLSGFHVDRSHLGMNFLLSATGLESQADSAFADADTTVINLATPNPPTGAYATTVVVAGAIRNVTVPARPPDPAVGGVLFWIDSSATTYYADITFNGVDAVFSAVFDSTTTFIAPGAHVLNFAYLGGACGADACNASVASVIYTIGSASVSTSTVITSGGGAVAVPFGVANTFSATVTITGGAGVGGGPGGVVRFVDLSTGTTLGNANIATADDTHGIASLTVNDAAACPSSVACIRPPYSPHMIRATYIPATGNGFAPSDTSIGGDAALTVTQISPNWGVLVNPEPSLVGGSITITATSPAVLGITPSGVGALVVNGATSGAPQAINNGVVVFSYTVSAAGTVPFGVTYAGDGVFLPQAGVLGAGGDAVNHTTNPAVTTTVVSSIPNTPASYGAPVAYRATVASPTGGTPTGTVHFYDNSVDVTGCTAVVLLSNGTADCTPAAPGPVPGDHTLTAAYVPGGPSFTGSNSPIYTLRVNKAAAGEAFTAFSPASIAYGTATNAVMHLTPVTGVGSAGGRLSGTVGLYEGSTLLATSASFGGVDGALDISIALPDSVIKSAGAHTLTMRYAGDANYSASVAPYAQQTLTVTKAATSLATVTNTAGTGVFGTPMTFSTTLSITGLGAGTPTGTISFMDGANTVGAATVNAGAGAYTVTSSTLGVGNHSITAVYSGDANFQTFTTGTALNQTITRATLGVSITSPTVTALPIGTNVVYGQTVTLRATLTGVAGTPAVGSIEFDAGGVALCAASAIATNAFGTTATCTVQAVGPLGVGTRSVTVSNLGVADTNYLLPSTIPPYSFVVAKANTATAPTATPAAVSPNQTVTFTAAVSVVSPGVAPISGNTVTFTSNGSAIACTNASPGIIAGGVATCTTSFGTAGVYNIVAAYTTDANTAASQGALVLSISKPVPVLTTSSSVNPLHYGGSVVFTGVATAPAYSGPPATSGPVPQGSLQFNNGAAILGTVALSPISGQPASQASMQVGGCAAGQPNCVAALLTGGNHAITVLYVPGGDPNYGSALSSSQTSPPGVLNEVVDQAASKVGDIQVTANPSVPVYGQPVTLTVTVTPFDTANTGKPTGTVTFDDAGNAFPAVAVNPATGVATTTITTLGVGSHTNTLHATYSGDGNFAGSAASPGSATIAVAPTEIFLGALPASPTYGQSVTLTARVCALAFGVVRTGSPDDCRSVNAPLSRPNWRITFYDGTTAIGTTSAVDALGNASLTLTLVNPSGVNAPVVGTHAISAAYNADGGDTNYGVSTSLPSNLVVALAPTQTTVTTNVSAPVTGQVFVLHAVVASAGSFGPPPAGMVDFVDSSGGGFAIGTGTLVANGAYAFADLTAPTTGVNALAVGTHVITANYRGSSAYAISNSPTSGATALVLMVSKASTVTALSLCAIQTTGACTTDTPVIGQTVKLTASLTVTAPGAGAPTGSVQFFNGTALLGTAAVTLVSGVYQASYQVTLPMGALSLTAIYSGDSGFTTSTSPVVTQSVTKPNVNINIASNLNPAILGAPVTFTVVIAPAPPATGVPTGPVTFWDGVTQLSSPILLVGGAASFTPPTSAMFVATHPIGVTYNGDANFQGFNSGPLVYEAINKVPASLYLTSNSFTAVASQVITLAAQVAGPASLGAYPAATGQVQFYDGTTMIGVGALTGGFATLNINNLATGLHNLSAVYGGDGNWTNATSVYVAQTISKASTVTQIASSVNPAVSGQQVVFTVNVAVPAPGTLPATGQVQMYDNNNPLGNPQLANNGAFTIPVQSFTPGTHSIYAQYLGDANFASSQSATLSLVVNKAPTATTLAVMPYSSTSGQSVTLTAVVNLTAPGSGVPTGSVQFVDTTSATILGSAPITVIGGVYTASITTSALNQAGAPRLLTATYSGDANFAASTSPAQTQSVFANQISVTNAAGYQTTHFAPDQIGNLWGDYLSDTTLSATTIPLPTGLAGTTVRVLDSAGVSRLAPLFYVSPGQVNFVVPSNTAFGLATITVTTSGGVSASTMVLITHTAPGIFSSNNTGQGVAAAQLVITHANGSQDLLPALATYDSTQRAYVAVPVSLGTATDTATLVLYGTGVRYRPGPLSVTATVNGSTIPVQYAGAQPQYAGLDQMNINLPRTLVGAGVVGIYVTVDGEISNTVTLTVR